MPRIPPPRAGIRVGYVLSRFPKLTETFILFEILELQRQGVDVRVHALIRERSAAVHPDAERLLSSVVFPDGFGGVLMSQLRWFRQRPGTYLGLWWEALAGNLRSPRFLLRSLATVPLGANLAAHMASADLDHVHAHWATHSALAGMVAARLLGVTFSFTGHAHDLYVNRSMLRQKIKAASFVVTISEYNRRLLESLYPRETTGKLLVVHCGVDLDELTPPNRDRSAGLRIVCVASLQPQKGHAVLIDALAVLRARGIQARLAMVGDGPESEALMDRVARLQLTNAVTFLGALPRPGVLEELRAADVMALASAPIGSGKMEGIPVALMEGMAVGMPVVATNISGIPELVDDGVNGYLVPPDDANALADALASLAADTGMVVSMGLAARQKVTDEFDLRTSGRLLRQQFSSAARPRSAKRRSDGSSKAERDDDRQQQDDQRQDGGSKPGDGAG